MRRSHVCHLTLDEKDRLVEQVQDLRARLVNGAHHRAAHLGELLEHRDHIVGRAGVEAAGGLVEESDLGVRDKLRAHRCALALAAGNALDELVPDDGVSALRQPHAPQKVVNQSAGGIGRVAVQPQLRCEFQHLTRCHRAQERVVLHHVTEYLLVFGRLDDLAVDPNLPGDVSLAAPPLAHTPGEDVEHAGLAATRRPQDARELAGAQVTAHFLQDLLSAALRDHREAQLFPTQGRRRLVLVDEREHLHLGLARPVGGEG
mmetsp:Transcript_27025/g.54123  ORF Transcript_27025/g.54123 Transcript_27025/m.54123 type:complete len:260 (-) Transcript_27025:153-932(-)